jgi:hypothetical protein
MKSGAKVGKEISLKFPKVGNFRKVVMLDYLCRMIRLVLILAFFTRMVIPAGGQDVSNPFELKPRLLKKTAAMASNAHAPALTSPFDVMPHRPPGASKALAENITKPFRPASILPRGGDTLPDAVLFSILAGIFAFLTFCVAANRKVVGTAWRGFLNDNGLTVAHREASGFVGLTPYFLLYACFLLNAGMFMFLLARVYRKETFNNWLFLLICMLSAAAIFLSKHILLSIASWLFPVEKEVQRYNFLVVLFNCVLGLFLVPFNFLLAFSAAPKREAGNLTGSDNLTEIWNTYANFLPFWTLGLVAIFYVYRGIRSASISSKFLADNQFHFLLYLCAVEIAPVLLLIKLALIQAKI